MKINYKKELETASRSMILVHEPATLIKLVLRTFVQKVKVRHACMLLHDKHRDTYVLTVSRGTPGLRLPAGFARMDADDNLIRAFRVKRIHAAVARNGIVGLDAMRRKLRGRQLDADVRRVLSGAAQQMELFEAVIAVPAYYRDQLLGLILLGRKAKGPGFTRNELNFFTAMASSVSMALRNAQLFKELEEELNKKRSLFFSTTVALTAAIDAKDHYTHGHTSRVTNLSLLLARELQVRGAIPGHEDFIDHLQIASLLHDIGKIGIPETILNKQGPLNADERVRMQEHPLVGASILEPIRELEDCLLGVKYHHERFDGTGYPDGLRGDQIPIAASIIAVADAFDAMITDRPYRRGLAREEAARIIARESGSQFDPVVIDAFLELSRAGKI